MRNVHNLSLFTYKLIFYIYINTSSITLYYGFIYIGVISLFLYDINLTLKKYSYFLK